MAKEELGTLYYAAFVPNKETESRILRRGKAVTRLVVDEFGQQIYIVSTDIGDTFAGLLDDVLSTPYGGKHSLYAFGRTKDEPVALLKKFLEKEQKDLTSRLKDIEHEIETVCATADWAEEAKERGC